MKLITSLLCTSAISSTLQVAEVEHMSLALPLRTSQPHCPRRQTALARPFGAATNSAAAPSCNLFLLAHCSNFGLVHNSVAARSFHRS
jgi:hypothetical protein